MNERHFTVTDGMNTLACGMTFDMAITFITGYYQRYYNEKLQLEIVEEFDDDEWSIEEKAKMDEVEDGTDL